MGPSSVRLPRAESITHEHLLSIVHSESKRFSGRCIRVLDIGCGNGHLIAYFMEAFHLLDPGMTFEMYGFDVEDPGVQERDFFKQALDALSRRVPGVDWSDRLCLIPARERWPYPDDFFDVIISNQVLEHVDDPDLVFSEIRRVMRTEGFSVHLFPLKHYVYEGHLHLPFVHRIQSYDLMLSYIRTLSRLGMGKFRSHRKASGVPLDVYAERHADYMHYLTHYIGYRDALRLAKKHRMRISFRYTGEFYRCKLRSMFRLKPRYEYKTDRSSLCEWLSVFILKYISCITLFLEKRETYTTRR